MDTTSSKGGSGEHIEAAPVQRKGKFARHCARRWWIWLIAFCLFVLVIMIIIVYAIFPAVAQKELNKTYLTLHSMEIRNTTADSFSLSLNSTISGASGIASHSHLDPMEVSFYTEDSEEPFMTLPLPGIKGGGDIPIIVENVHTDIANMAEFGGFAGLLLSSEDLSFDIKGRTTIHVGKLKSKVNYNEEVSMKGFNKLEGMEIQTTNFISETDANLGGKVFIPNPTVATVEMGNVHILLSLQGQALGTGVIPNLTITPGDHQYDYKANFTQDALRTLIGVIASGSAIELTVQGNGTEVDGVDIPWLTGPLGALNVTVPIHV